ncbi:ABC transporter substrate-binding protein [Fictibacillus barbaricus]|uniref:ABC transporter substrate-binding protein n=1 Tax=Fictibacillus barbaricus TaxID=182136 RepID=A0ABS2ZCG2_9BACL|nr:ABC transporter substrate-binding protein [Fictibacillus barbaricus]MBN3545382.1 ABC transporter substrate-binding protein [Fictibacillus barbaricus]GGB59461.1 branched-chain amino acid ABC transporter substrate-binding protein [Fictibacillus barbaricus]
MKKWVWLFVTVLFLFTISACSDSSSGEGDEIIIGGVFSASGPAAPLGKGEMDTVKMLVDKVNEDGGIDGKKIKLISYDDKSDQNEAVLSMKKLIEQEKVHAVIGGTISGNTLAMIPLAEKSEIPFISLAASKQIHNPDDKSSRKWIFKTAQGDDVVIPKVLQYLKDEGLTKIAWLNVANAYGTSGHTEFAAMAKDFGIEAVVEEEFEATVTDAKAMLTRVKKEKPQAVVVWGTAQESAVITKNIRQIGMDVPIINSHGIGTKQFIELAGAEAEGIIFPIGRLLVADQLGDDDKQKEKLLTYQKDYEAEFNAPPSTFGGHSWDAFYLLVEAIKKADGTDPKKVRDALEKDNGGFVGISGVFNINEKDHNGLSKDSLVMVKIKDGGWVINE